MITCNNKSSKMSSKIQEIELVDRQVFNKLASHPLQSWEWGEFRKKTGIEVIRLGKFEKGTLVETAQLTIHPIPFTSRTIGYVPKGQIPSNEMLRSLYEIGKKHRCIFIKFEPNVETIDQNSQFSLASSPHPLFTKYTFQLDLTISEEALLKNMHSKTRY